MLCMLGTLTTLFRQATNKTCYILGVDDHIDNVYSEHGCDPNLPSDFVVLVVDSMKPDHLVTKEVRDKCPVDLKVIV